MSLKKNQPGCPCCEDGEGVSLPGCPCANIPTTLIMTATGSGAGCGTLLQDATIVYQDTPPGLLPLGIGSPSFLSNETFEDFPGSPDVFRYYFTCVNGLYAITRVFEESIYGSPYRDAVLYRWLIGVAGNTCDPFELTNGEVFSGGGGCVVEIVGQ